jgi:trk system potassium uptake protein TrkH
MRSPRGAIIPVKVGGKVYEESEVIEVALFSLLYLTFLGVGSILMTLLGFSFINSLFEVASAQGNVGLSVGIVSPNLHILGKVVLIIEMWVGRLEILPVIMFLQKIARKA